jgi:hypothetical protein
MFDANPSGVHRFLIVQQRISFWFVDKVKGSSAFVLLPSSAT